ncbi:polysaccharide pyruvyl transferase family protein [Fusobacterium necrogenes]|uniref:polysaccharide pyruvyl transferase family protein n=1 Tax=Fusobacterium necrogenes TaxID=858 RepID=UPI00255C918E|nr:polysaccharide pyruvyl transferase family protein [Fusobacterium necrogenes]
MKKEKIVIFNTAIGSLNTGDYIIMESCNKIVKKIFNNYFFVDIPTHIYFNIKDRYLLSENKFMFVCGTNLLRDFSVWSKKNQWKVGGLFLLYILLKKINNVVLVGVGWSGYKYTTKSFFKNYLLRKLLNNGHIHSVRDEFTKQKLNEIGIYNVINTGCLTTWELTEEHCNTIPKIKSKKVIVTLTDYDRDVKKDKQMFKILEKNYDKLYFWAQGSEDLEYIDSLLKNSINYEVISPNLEAYEEFLESNECDFVGTRLHGGIKALQNKRRTIIIGIDNRAIEMSEIGLPVIKRENIETDLEKMINSKLEIKINLPIENIEKWKAQFKIGE